MDLQLLKKRAREELSYAVKIGRIKKPERCEGCNKIRPLQGHHPCYARSLKVKWLCTKCHSKLDRAKLRGKKYRSRRSKGSESPGDSMSEGG